MTNEVPRCYCCGHKFDGSPRVAYTTEGRVMLCWHCGSYYCKHDKLPPLRSGRKLAKYRQECVIFMDDVCWYELDCEDLDWTLDIESGLWDDLLV